MDAIELRDFIDSKFQVPVVEGEDKLCPLDEAIRRHVKKGMTINFAGRGGALLYQLIREFWGKKPDFTLVSTGVGGTVLALIQGKMVKKFITSFAGDGYPTPGPNPLVQKVYLSGEVEFENWTMLTIPQRLLAGAMGWGFIPTRSLVGSSMEEENKESFTVISDPFNPGENRPHRIYTPTFTFSPNPVLYGQGSMRGAIWSSSRRNDKLWIARI